MLRNTIHTTAAPLKNDCNNKAMKALFLTKHSAMGASSRYRALQYFPYLRSHGWKIVWQPLLSDAYLVGLYRRGTRSLAEVVKGLVRRLRFLCLNPLDHFDVVYVEDEIFPRLPAALEAIFFTKSQKLILDYDDAVFLPYQGTPLMENKISALMRSAAEVLVGNEFLRSYASQFTSNITVIPTVIDMAKYAPRASYELLEERVVVGWIGTPSTIHHLAAFAPVLRKLSMSSPILLRCVGAPSDFDVPGIRIERVNWSEETESRIVRTFDIGVMPLCAEPFAQGKCGLKLLQYMGCGVPAVGQKIGANADIICDGANGYLASSDDEYVAKIEALIGDQGLRAKIGSAGRRTVEEHYSLQAAAQVFSDVLTRVAEGADNSALDRENGRRAWQKGKRDRARL